MHRLLCAFLLLVTALTARAQAPGAWAEAARPGAIVLFRHATAPGVGDPSGMKVGDCSTQRNLDDSGRAEARRIGEQFRSRGIAVGAVLSSQWCRTRDTARLAFGADRVRDEPAFNSFFGQAQGGRDEQTARAREVLARWKGPGTLVVVTHQVNITALTGLPSVSAHGVVVRAQPDGSLKVAGTVTP